MTESIRDGLDKLAGNHGVDVPDSIGEGLPYVSEIVLGIRFIWDMVRTERELTDVDLTERSRVGIRVLGIEVRYQPGLYVGWHSSWWCGWTVDLVLGTSLEGSVAA